MNTGLKSIALGFLLVAGATAPCFGQQNDDANDHSLGAIARKLNAQKAKESKPAKIYTNDNLSGSESDVSVSNPAPKEAKPSATTPKNPDAKAPTHDEVYFQSRMENLKSKLETNQRELDVLQQKLGQNNMQQYANNPNKSLQQQYSREDINKLKAEIDAKQLEVDADNKAIDDLRDQLRHEGGDPGWLR